MFDFSKTGSAQPGGFHWASAAARTARLKTSATTCIAITTLWARRVFRPTNLAFRDLSPRRPFAPERAPRPAVANELRRVRSQDLGKQVRLAGIAFQMGEAESSVVIQVQSFEVVGAVHQEIDSSGLHAFLDRLF
jgi:hypothetical protein